MRKKTRTATQGQSHKCGLNQAVGHETRFSEEYWTQERPPGTEASQQRLLEVRATGEQEIDPSRHQMAMELQETDVLKEQDRNQYG